MAVEVAFSRRLYSRCPPARPVREIAPLHTEKHVESPNVAQKFFSPMSSTAFLSVNTYKKKSLQRGKSLELQHTRRKKNEAKSKPEVTNNLEIPRHSSNTLATMSSGLLWLVYTRWLIEWMHRLPISTSTTMSNNKAVLEILLRHLHRASRCQSTAVEPIIEAPVVQ